jgi:hypothetical protein
MFRITSETCHAFTFAEVLILAAMNVESTRLAAGGQARPKAAAQRGYFSATQVLCTRVRKAVQV